MTVVSHPLQVHFLHGVLQDNINANKQKEKRDSYLWLWCSSVQELVSKRRKQSRSCDATCCARTSPDSSGARLAHGHPVTVTVRSALARFPEQVNDLPERQRESRAAHTRHFTESSRKIDEHYALLCAVSSVRICFSAVFHVSSAENRTESQQRVEFWGM